METLDKTRWLGEPAEAIPPERDGLYQGELIVTRDTAMVFGHEGLTPQNSKKLWQWGGARWNEITNLSC